MNCQAQCLYTFTLWRPWANELLAAPNIGGLAYLVLHWAYLALH